ncbi:B-box zinc finger protein 22-like [Zingiber officinale]|uniref:B-box zinc finger protein 22-like n=1 Tax=Zingiber officinale TaxID=94328 RepID=UPI001C4B9AB6|nr:B-box zinc finger protein 22-like [Zingiber officinale]
MLCRRPPRHRLIPPSSSRPGERSNADIKPVLRLRNISLVLWKWQSNCVIENRMGDLDRRGEEGMKIQCEACEMVAATVICFADEAALCWACDAKMHAAGTLAVGHQRYPLFSGGSSGSASGSSRRPNCDICQEAPGGFFCLEDRAVFCRNCDVNIHTMNPHVRVHQRFLLTGVQVGLHSVKPLNLIASQHLNSAGREQESSPSNLLPTNMLPTPLPSETNQTQSTPLSGDLKLPSVGCSTHRKTPDWPLDDLFVFPSKSDLHVNDHDCSQIVKLPLGSTDGSNFYCSPGTEMGLEKCLDSIPDFSWIVPDSASQPTVSDLRLQKDQLNSSSPNGILGPDVWDSPRS